MEKTKSNEDLGHILGTPTGTPTGTATGRSTSMMEGPGAGAESGLLTDGTFTPGGEGAEPDGMLSLGRGADGLLLLLSGDSISGSAGREADGREADGAPLLLKLRTLLPEVVLCDMGLDKSSGEKQMFGLIHW